jgi:amidase
MNTTAGSYALLGSVVPDDAGVIKRLRKAGAIILGNTLNSVFTSFDSHHRCSTISTGKANLSEWAHFRGLQAFGWSARGGQATNPYFPKGDPCGSSSGSGVAPAIGLTAVALGTETDGSITCPASYNNVVGIKPTVGSEQLI